MVTSGKRTAEAESLPGDESSANKFNMADLYLLCFIPSPLFHAHWSIFVPSTSDSRRGTVINVRGGPLHGFVHEFERDYVPREDPDKIPYMTKLTAVPETLVRPEIGLAQQQPGKDSTACTELERIALSVDAPGPSLGRQASKDGRTRVEIRDCQWWVGQLVARMIEAELVGAEAQAVLDNAPRH